MGNRVDTFLRAGAAGSVDDRARCATNGATARRHVSLSSRRCLGPSRSRSLPTIALYAILIVTIGNLSACGGDDSVNPIPLDGGTDAKKAAATDGGADAARDGPSDAANEGGKQ
jgi:hypothetical protein